MRNTSKISTLEAKFPLLAVEHGCLVSKDADLTIAFKLELPELFTVTESEYEAMHSAWHKAIKVLPNYSIVHKQDWFIQEYCCPVKVFLMIKIRLKPSCRISASFVTLLVGKKILVT